jgi:hypothetical protein
VGKFCSFGFAKGRLVCRAKPNVQNVRLANSIFFVRWGVLIFSWVGYCVAKLVYGLCRNTAKLSAEFGRPKSLVKMSKVDVLVVWLMVVVSSVRLACNVSL